MLDEQFFSDSTFGEHVNKNYVAILAMRGENIGDELREAYGTRATPTVVISEANGSEIDRIVGYRPPPENFMTKVNNIYNRIDTFDKLKELHAKNPDDLAVTFKLAYKYERGYRDEEKSKELYEIILDRPEEAKNVMVPYEDTDEIISVYEWTLYLRAQETYDINYFKILIDEFPDSRFSETAFDRVGSNMAYSGKSEEAEPFFERLLEKFPYNINLLGHYVSYCVRTESNIEKGIEIGKRIDEIDRNLLNKNLAFIDYAELLILKGDKEGADRVFGRSHISRQVGRLNATLGNYIGFWARVGGNDEGVEEAIDLMLKLDMSGRNRSRVAGIYIYKDELDNAIELYGPDYMADKKGDTTEEKIAIIDYINFWARHGENLESALEIALQYKELIGGRISPQTLAQLYAKMDKMEEALKYYGPDYIKDYMTKAPSLNSYAWFWAREGKNLESALDAAKKSIELEPDQYNWDTLSMVYWKMKKYKEAIEAEEKALELSPGNEMYLKRIEDIKKDMKKKGGK